MISRIKLFLLGLPFLIGNFSRFLRVAAIPEFRTGGVIVRGCRRGELSSAFLLYSHLNDGGEVGYVQRILYYFLSERCFLVALQDDAQGQRSVVGVDLYYLNPRDLREGTVHEGFIGVHPATEGKGVATTLRRQALRHFRNAKFSGVSTRISVSNPGSLRSASKLGFEQVEEYVDACSGEQRLYMVCKIQERSD
ncbi:GNAT family N-acetyltransferase [Pseudomonas sp. BW13M1]|uniref:GNAT family N-acetyltransferase n=1 Tax=Pseudomonas peradeniyensis TaxID=2745488 RepID=A0A923K147_9PSED|nr:GNAT family N-acetyltransferase [Pseudomonas peradeniyensis]MBV4503466.1 GNAT family N-acetyltransferase [Pseudomonas peradeniyensis]